MAKVIFGLEGSQYDRVPVITATSRNGDMSKWRQSKTATNEVKVTTISQNGDNHWSKRRRILVKTVTIVSQNGDRRTSRSQSICFAHAFIRRLCYNSQLLNGRLSLHDQLNVLKFNSSFAVVTSANNVEKRKTVDLCNKMETIASFTSHTDTFHIIPQTL